MDQFAFVPEEQFKNKQLLKIPHTYNYFYTKFKKRFFWNMTLHVADSAERYFENYISLLVLLRNLNKKCSIFEFMYTGLINGKIKKNWLLGATKIFYRV